MKFRDRESERTQLSSGRIPASADGADIKRTQMLASSIGRVPGLMSQIVSVLEDREAERFELASLLTEVGLTVRTWTSATDFLEAHDHAAPGCLVMDIQMPGITGLELQQRLKVQGNSQPIVFTSRENDIGSVVQAMKAGAVTILSKPVQPVELLDAVREALTLDTLTRASQRDRQDICNRLATLTPREREVLDLVAAGLLNKEIARELNTTERTVKTHRHRVMKKMQVRTATALVRFVSRTTC